MSEESLFIAISQDKVDEVIELINNFEDIDKGISVHTSSSILHSKPSPLSISCFFGATETFQYLLNSGSSIEHEDQKKI